MKTLENRLERLEAARPKVPPMCIIIDDRLQINQDEIDAMIADRGAKDAKLILILPEKTSLTELPSMVKKDNLSAMHPEKLKGEKGRSTDSINSR